MIKIFSNINNVNIKVSISYKNQDNIEEDLNESELYNFDRNLKNNKGTEFKLFENNKMKFSNLKSVRNIYMFIYYDF